MVELLAEESAKNPEFAQRLDDLMTALPSSKRAAASKPQEKAPKRPAPDVHAEWQARGEAGVRVWLREQPVSDLRAIIQAQDLDPTRRTAKWREAEKLAGYIVDGLRARLARGSSFMATGRTEEQEKAE
ncbi:MAG: hypothetical protein O9319_00225 [Gemmatimonas sp.]|uniref:hypothetical protein n=1 Tax=Gemmatimonas sp. TaxID=1962908 RepID=UPI0022C221F8|nr:hypothetical protein [Gemmatimonas sp.]MCZ8012982.1 hypothetical protein [Gemmatimonas sp.]MCZ8265255.1 hypothetical protein [Gemmatimonas sp.]